MVQVVRFELTIFPPQTERDNQITLHLYKKTCRLFRMRRHEGTALVMCENIGRTNDYLHSYSDIQLFSQMIPSHHNGSQCHMLFYIQTIPLVASGWPT